MSFYVWWSFSKLCAYLLWAILFSFEVFKGTSFEVFKIERINRIICVIPSSLNKINHIKENNTKHYKARIPLEKCEREKERKMWGRNVVLYFYWDRKKILLCDYAQVLLAQVWRFTTIFSSLLLNFLSQYQKTIFGRE